MGDILNVNDRIDVRGISSKISDKINEQLRRVSEELYNELIKEVESGNITSADANKIFSKNIQEYKEALTLKLLPPGISIPKSKKPINRNEFQNIFIDEIIKLLKTSITSPIIKGVYYDESENKVLMFPEEPEIRIKNLKVERIKYKINKKSAFFEIKYFSSEEKTKIFISDEVLIVNDEDFLLNL